MANGDLLVLNCKGGGKQQEVVEYVIQYLKENVPNVVLRPQGYLLVTSVDADQPEALMRASRPATRTKGAKKMAKRR